MDLAVNNICLSSLPYNKEEYSEVKKALVHIINADYPATDPTAVIEENIPSLEKFIGGPDHSEKAARLRVDLEKALKNYFTTKDPLRFQSDCLLLWRQLPA